MIMNTRAMIFLALGLALSSSFVRSAETVRFTGDESGRTPVFETDGPWLLDWSTRSKTALPTNLELRLYAGGGKEFIGTIAQLEGVGRGLKLFENTGSLQIEVVAQNLVWELLIKPVEPETAGRLERSADGAPSLEDAAVKAMRRVREGSFSSWRPVDERNLLLFGADGSTGYRVSFDVDCKGLSAATALSFVTGSGGSLDDYDSILLDDGTRCYFDRVMPTVFD